MQTLRKSILSRSAEHVIAKHLRSRLFLIVFWSQWSFIVHGSDYPSISLFIYCKTCEPLSFSVVASLLSNYSLLSFLSYIYFRWFYFNFQTRFSVFFPFSNWPFIASFIETDNEKTGVNGLTGMKTQPLLHYLYCPMHFGIGIRVSSFISIRISICTFISNYFISQPELSGLAMNLKA